MERRYTDDYKHLHATVYHFGGRHTRSILSHILALKPKSIIDYGAGRSEMANKIARKLGISDVARFDPAVEGIDTVPNRRFDLLISCDVLEHIPEEELDAVIKEMADLADHHILVIDMKPASATLLDGRNAHVSLHPAEWWQERLSRFIPNLRPIRIHEPARCGFKTWAADLPFWRRWIIERVEGREWEKTRRANRARRRAARGAQS